MSVDHKRTSCLPSQGECQLFVCHNNNKKAAKAKFERTMNELLYRQCRMDCGRNFDDQFSIFTNLLECKVVRPDYKLQYFSEVFK